MSSSSMIGSAASPSTDLSAKLTIMNVTISAVTTQARRRSNMRRPEFTGSVENQRR